VTTPQRYMDEIDADREVNDWIHGLAERFREQCGMHIEYYGLTYNCEQPTNGRVVNLWQSGRLVAQAVLVRDAMNWTVLTRHEYC